MSSAALGLCPDAPPVLQHDSVHGREPDAGARILGSLVHALEGREELGRVGHVEARAVVAHAVRPALLPAELYSGALLARGELAGVVEEVGQGDLDEPAVAMGLEAALD